MGIQEVQLISNTYHDNILSSLHQLRLQGQLSDVTVLVDYQGDVQEFQAHQVMLAASSGYFKKILLSQDATQNRLQLSNMHSTDFSKFLDFVYTGRIEVARDKIGDFQAMAKFLDCEDLTKVCGEAVSGEVPPKVEKFTSGSKSGRLVGGASGDESVTKKRRLAKSRLDDWEVSPQGTEKEAPVKRIKLKSTEEKKRERKLKLRLGGRKVLHRRWYTEKEAFNNKNQAESEAAEKSMTEAETQAENNEEADSEISLIKHAADVESEDDGQSNDPEDHSVLMGEDQHEEEEEEDGGEEGQSNRPLRRTSKSQFECNKCQRVFHYERSFLKHISTFHGVKAAVVYRCDTCFQTFVNRSNLKIHEKHVHNNERLFSCNSCNKTFKRKKDVVRHQRQVHERNMQHVCPVCGKALSSRTALLLHERTHTGTKPFECSDCGARFTQNSALKMHRRTHTGEKPFACDECEARFTQKHMLAYHKRSHSGERPFMCEACGKSFASKEYLRHHSNIHTGSRPYKCEQCGRAFAQRNSLNQHLKIHTGERPYSCKECEKQFTQLNALQRHQRIHTGEKPYMCGLCKRTFTDKSTLRRHTMIHDSDAPWKTYLVVLEGNVEEKKPKSPTKGKTEKGGSGEKKSAARRSTGATPAPAPASVEDELQVNSIEVPAEAVTLPSDWASHSAIALVSHGALGGITVIHTEVPPGTQLQPIMAADGSAASVISLDGSTIPFSIPVSIAHSVPLSSEAPPTSLSAPSISVPVSEGLLASVTDIPTVSASSLLVAAASTILAPVSENKTTSEDPVLPPDIQTVIVDEETCKIQRSNADQCEEQLKGDDTDPEAVKDSDPDPPAE